MPTRIDVHHVDAYYHDTRAVEGVTMSFEPGEVTALIGPSGCGKSTFLRTLNRMHEVVPGARVHGSVRMDGIDLYGRDIDPTAVRRQIGMVFQRPNPFPSMSIYDNVIAGFTIAGIRRRKSELDEIVEGSLRAANLWTEVAHRLGRSGASLSGGQQQRLCIARAIAVRPSVLLMDEPCSSLDPLSTRAIEELIVDLKSAYTVVIVTHNMQQAERISDKTAFFNVADQGMPGRLVEYGPTPVMFSAAGQQATRDYIEGRFG